MKTIRKKTLILDGTTAKSQSLPEIQKRLVKSNNDQVDPDLIGVDSSPIIKPADLNASAVGFMIVIPIVGGVILGRIIDVKLATSPKFTLILLFLGIIIGFSNIFYIIKKISKP